MAWIHPNHPGRRVRLGFCTNVLPVETLPELRHALAEVAVPLRERLRDTAPRALGIGLHIPAALAAQLCSPEGSADLADLAHWLAGEQLDPFTYNAFPFGGFHAKGLKESVYRPTWAEPEREQYTLHVAQIARALTAARVPGDPLGHLSISTHPGSYGPWVTDRSELKACADGMARVGLQLAQLATHPSSDGAPIVLSLEAEPFASSPTTAALAEFLIVARHRLERELKSAGRDSAQARILAGRHLGVCLDACHSAVEFEDPGRAWALASGAGAGRAAGAASSPDSGAAPNASEVARTGVGDPTGLGKLQFSSALALKDPAAHPAACAHLLSLDEPVYLHQLRAQSPTGPLALADIADLAALLSEAPPAGASSTPPGTADLPGGRIEADAGARASSQSPSKSPSQGAKEWLSAPEWRCHFHVPVDLEQFQSLSTTRAHADALLLEALADAPQWPSHELHVEVETYTWSILPRPPSSPAEWVDGLEGELRHVQALLLREGWRPT